MHGPPFPTCVQSLSSLPYPCHCHFSRNTAAICIRQPLVIACGNSGWAGWGAGAPAVSLSHFFSSPCALPGRGGRWCLPLAPLAWGTHWLGSPSPALSTPPTQARMPMGTALAAPMGFSTCHPQARTGGKGTHFAPYSPRLGGLGAGSEVMRLLVLLLEKPGPLRTIKTGVGSPGTIPSAYTG